MDLVAHPRALGCGFKSKSSKIVNAKANFTVCIYTEPIVAFKQIIWGSLDGGGSP